ncbi:MAG: hypothetical protein V1906_01970 [Candidatus Woesearchaeota archaeon]
MKKYESLGLIGRFKPLHIGGELMLKAVCGNAEKVVIGIGSCNKYNMRNPFTPEETKDMIEAVLAPCYSNYSVVFIPDFAHMPEYADGQRWKQEIVGKFGKLEVFVSGNDYVSDLLKDDYCIIKPTELIAPEDHVFMKSTMVRIAMAKGEDYRSMVPAQVSEYMERNGLVERFRKEFGLQTLVSLTDYKIGRESKEAERLHTTEE